MNTTTTIVGAFEAKTEFSQLLERVRQGEEITITRHDQPIARLIPTERSSSSDIHGAFGRMDEIRRRTQRASARRVKLSYRRLIEEGRRR